MTADWNEYPLRDTPSGSTPGPRPDAVGQGQGTDDWGPTPGRLTRRFRSGDRETRAVLADLCAQLALQGLDDDDLGTLELILAEALNNVTEHAYGSEGGPVEVSIDLITGTRGDPEGETGGQSPARVPVEAAQAAPTETGPPEFDTAAQATTCGRILCEVRDYGRPMPPDGPPGPGLPTIAPPDLLPEGGFGWHIIRCLVSHLSYERLGTCNRLRLEVCASHPLHSFGGGVTAPDHGQAPDPA